MAAIATGTAEDLLRVSGLPTRTDDMTLDREDSNGNPVQATFLLRGIPVAVIADVMHLAGINFTSMEDPGPDEFTALARLSDKGVMPLAVIAENAVMSPALDSEQALGFAKSLSLDELMEFILKVFTCSVDADDDDDDEGAKKKT